MPIPAKKYARIMEKIPEAEFNSIIDDAEWMLNESVGEEGRDDAIRVAVVARLIFGDASFTHRQISKACRDQGVGLVAHSIVELARDGIRL